MYMAPEMFQKGAQTPKLDVWSLFITMLWTLDTEGFRQKLGRFQSDDDVQEAVLHAASNCNTVSKIQEMSVINPKERASAAQMLVKCYNGLGLSTPQNQIPPLISTRPSPTFTPPQAPVLDFPAVPTLAALTRPRDLPMIKKTAADRGEFRVKKVLKSNNGQIVD
ncbi:hypothetical protein DV735_g5509, partial [Chaetothyriales sp. CBS 134920]